METFIENLLTSHIYATIVLLLCVMLLISRIIFIIFNPERERSVESFVSIYLLVLIIAIWFDCIVLSEFDFTNVIQIILNILFTSIFVYLLWDIKQEYNYMIDAKGCNIK